MWWFLALYRVDASRGKENQLSAVLEGVEAQLSLTSPSGLQPRMEALKAASRCVWWCGVLHLVCKYWLHAWASVWWLYTRWPCWFIAA